MEGDGNIKLIFKAADEQRDVIETALLMLLPYPTDFPGVEEMASTGTQISKVLLKVD